MAERSKQPSSLAAASCSQRALEINACTRHLGILAMARRGRQKKSSDGEAFTILYGWITPNIHSILLLYALMGADATLVSVVLCVLLARACFYFKSHKREHISIKFYKLPRKKKSTHNQTLSGKDTRSASKDTQAHAVSLQESANHVVAGWEPPWRALPARQASVWEVRSAKWRTEHTGQQCAQRSSTESESSQTRKYCH